MVKRAGGEKHPGVVPEDASRPRKRARGSEAAGDETEAIVVQVTGPAMRSTLGGRQAGTATATMVGAVNTAAKVASVAVRHSTAASHQVATRSTEQALSKQMPATATPRTAAQRQRRAAAAAQPPRCYDLTSDLGQRIHICLSGFR